jgi:hypothetical protein
MVNNPLQICPTIKGVSRHNVQIEKSQQRKENYKVRLNGAGCVLHASNPSTQEAEAGGSRVRG